MRNLQRFKRLTFACLFTAGMATAFGQMSNQSRKIPEGKWVLEQQRVKASIGCDHDRGVHAHEISVDSLNIVFYTEINVKQDTLFFTSVENTLQTTYTYTLKTGIVFDNPSIPFSSGGNVIADKLYVQQRIINPLNEGDTVYVDFVYELKK